MTLTETKKTFTELGKFLSQFKFEANKPVDGVLHNDLFYNDLIDLIALSQSHNRWFTKEQVHHAINEWANALTPENLDNWLRNYSFEITEPKTVAIIMAGNIPLVGFHDFLSVLISGHKALVKLSSNDKFLLPFLSKYLMAINPAMAERIEFTEEKLENFEAVIATGSNNTARYFEFYFKNKPSIIRKSRNSVAVLTGNETHEELVSLGEDIFRYFGLGCRNVSKIFVPEGYDFKNFFEAIFTYGDIIHYEKYANNYDYNKAVFLMSNFKLLDNEFITLKEDKSYASPISSLFYEYYNNLNELQQRLEADNEQIQCVVGGSDIDNSIPFGCTQKPGLLDYADNIDTLAFLSNL